MQTFNYYIWYIHSLYLCICYACSSALDTRRSVGSRMLHFLKHRPLVSPTEVQPNSMLNLTLSLWYKEDCKNIIYPFTPFLDLVLVCMILLHQSVDGSQLAVSNSECSPGIASLVLYFCCPLVQVFFLHFYCAFQLCYSEF